MCNKYEKQQVRKEHCSFCDEYSKFQTMNNKWVCINGHYLVKSNEIVCEVPISEPSFDIGKHTPKKVYRLNSEHGRKMSFKEVQMMTQ